MNPDDPDDPLDLCPPCGYLNAASAVYIDQGRIDFGPVRCRNPAHLALWDRLNSISRDQAA
jgi:hypothetical protein